MSGLMSRRKGLRTEYILRDYLRNLGIYEEVFRVPLSGSSEGFKQDVIARRAGGVDTFEMKARSREYDGVYALFASSSEDGVLRFNHLSTLVAISKDFNEVRKTGVVFPTLTKSTKTHSKLLRMRNLLQGADYLVIKGNNKPMLFIKYW